MLCACLKHVQAIFGLLALTAPQIQETLNCVPTIIGTEDKITYNHWTRTARIQSLLLMSDLSQLLCVYYNKLIFMS